VEKVPPARATYLPWARVSRALDLSGPGYRLSWQALRTIRGVTPQQTLPPCGRNREPSFRRAVLTSRGQTARLSQPGWDDVRFQLTGNANRPRRNAAEIATSGRQKRNGAFLARIAVGGNDVMTDHDGLPPVE
jgi:hypothetical protein